MQSLEMSESVDEKIANKLKMDYFQSWADKQSDKIGRYHDWKKQNNVIAVLGVPESLSPRKDKTEIIKKWIFGKNLVTDDGEIYYALKGCGETPATNENFLQGRIELNNPSSADTLVATDTYDEMLTPITASRKTITATYPQTVDPDADNTGDGTNVVTYKYEWTTTDFSNGGTTIKGGSIHDNASPTGPTKLLTHFNFASPFDKTTSDTLKVFVNHTMVGA
jgi:hypothetical protein